MPYIEIVADSKAHAEARAKSEHRVVPTHTQHAGRSKDGRNQYRVYYPATVEQIDAIGQHLVGRKAMFQGVKFVGDDQIDTIVRALSVFETYVCGLEDADGKVVDIELLDVSPEGITYRTFDEDLGESVGPETSVSWDDPAFVFLHVN